MPKEQQKFCCSLGFRKNSAGHTNRAKTRIIPQHGLQLYFRAYRLFFISIIAMIVFESIISPFLTLPHNSSNV